MSSSETAEEYPRLKAVNRFSGLPALKETPPPRLITLSLEVDTDADALDAFSESMKRLLRLSVDRSG
jgi:hypothetical protein